MRVLRREQLGLNTPVNQFFSQLSHLPGTLFEGHSCVPVEQFFAQMSHLPGALFAGHSRVPVLLRYLICQVLFLHVTHVF